MLAGENIAGAAHVGGELIDHVELAVDEEGTEAAAATAVTTTRASTSEFIKFSADKPFMFALRDQTGLIVIAGYVARPQAGEAPVATQ